MRLLQGYEVEIRNETHRANLLKDARYFHLKGLEQRLVACEKSYNLKRGRNEILIRLEDIRQTGISFTPDSQPSSPDLPLVSGYVSYARPYTDDATLNQTLILETGLPEAATICIHPCTTETHGDQWLTADVFFQGDTLRRMAALLKIIAAKMGLPSTQPLGLTQMKSEDSAANTAISKASNGLIKARIDRNCAMFIDGEAAHIHAGEAMGRMHGECVVKRAHWRIRIEPRGLGEEGAFAVLEVVKVDVFSEERVRNAARGFLGGA